MGACLVASALDFGVGLRLPAPLAPVPEQAVIATASVHTQHALCMLYAYVWFALRKMQCFTTFSPLTSTPKTSAHPNMSDFGKHVEQQVERAKIGKPSGRADLSVTLGYPDFEPAIPGVGEKEKEEDKLSAKVR
jgi:hypothetical protein